MPVFIPLAERVAGLSLHASQDGLSLYSVKLNWKNLQVRHSDMRSLKDSEIDAIRITERTNDGIRHDNRCSERPDSFS
jgi:hypothetical protein